MSPPGDYINAILGYGDIGSPGDFDGDRLDDLFGTGWEYGQGTVLVYGRRSTRAPHANPPQAPDAVRIRPVEAYFRDTAGPLGDVNGDGLGDVLVSPADSKTSVVIVLGRRKRATIDVHAPGQTGIWRMAAPGDLSSLGPIGDVNGDGIDDLGLSSPGGSGLNPGEPPVSTYIMLGTRGAPPRDIRAPGAAGFVIR